MESKVGGYSWFLIGLLLPIPLFLWLDQTLVYQFGRSYWSLPRELAFFLGWPLVAFSLWFILRRTRYGKLALGMAWSGAFPLLILFGYLGLLVAGFLGDVLLK